MQRTYNNNTGAGLRTSVLAAAAMAVCITAPATDYDRFTLLKSGNAVQHKPGRFKRSQKKTKR